MSKPESLALPHVSAIPPYPPGRPIAAVARDFGLDPAGIVKLASNENPRGPSPKAVEALAAANPDVSRYPDNECFDLRQALGASLGVDPANLLIGAGSSELILLAARAFLERGRNAVLSQYSFVSYEGAIRSVDAHPKIVPARAMGADLDAMLSAIDAGTSLLFLATPNNPTGTLVPPSHLRAFLKAVPERVVVVLDEAYRDYLDPADCLGDDELLSLRPNLLVLRTFSKIHGLAGLRVGYGMGDPALLGLLRRLQLPFSVPLPAQAAAIAALGDRAFIDGSREMNRAERARLGAGLAAMGLDFVPSHGNFLLVRTGNGGGLFQALQKRGVIVRPVGNYGLADWIRVSVGLPAENDIFLGHLREAISEGGIR
jgi:histidinol-phosphate aminotransferase